MRSRLHLRDGEGVSNCLVTYECRDRGCYAETVGMAMMCPGVASREASAAVEESAREALAAPESA